MSRHKTLLALPVLVLATCLPATASAQDDLAVHIKEDERTCEIAFALDDLRQERREELFRTCRTEDIQIREWDIERTTSGTADGAPDDRYVPSKETVELIRQGLADLIAYDGWQVASLERMFDTRILAHALGWSSAQVSRDMKLLGPIFEELGKPAGGTCKKIYRQLEDYVSAHGPSSESEPYPPFTVDAFRNREKKCAKGLAEQDLDDLFDRYHFFVVVAESDAATFFWGGKQPGYRRMAKDQGLAVGEHTAYVTLLPRLVPAVGWNEPVVFVAKLINLAGPVAGVDDAAMQGQFQQLGRLLANRL